MQTRWLELAALILSGLLMTSGLLLLVLGVGWEEQRLGLGAMIMAVWLNQNRG